MVRISVMELTKTLFGEEESVIGTTVIDIEDRWFNARYRDMVAADAVPIEARRLRSSNSFFSKGHLRLWVEVMSVDESNERQICLLPPSEPAPFQLRVVIWKVTQVVCLEEGVVPDLFVVGRHVLDNGVPLRQETDTHFSADDGAGTFNWRFLFDLMVPCRDPRLLLQVWDRNLLTRHDSLAEVTLDMTRDFIRARKSNCATEIPRGTVHVMHPALPGEARGLLEVQAVLLPSGEAATRPVGSGRDHPNEDPFLDGNDPHLVEHRDFIRNLEIVKNVKDLGSSLYAGFKGMVIIYAVGTVLGALVFFAFTIFIVTR